MLYILLIIIAVGVLLMSSEGKDLLNYLIWLGGIVGVLYIGFWLVVGSTALVSGHWKQIETILGIVFLACIVIYWIFNGYKALQTKEKRKEIWQNFKKGCTKMWKENPKITIFLLLALGYITYTAFFLS